MSIEADLGRYLEDARQLRASMDLNARDYQLAKDGKLLIYFVDANIVGMFADPIGNQQHLAVFRNWLDESVFITTITVTAEFLFSRKLPGQHNEPAIMTPDHYDDLLSMAGAIHKKGIGRADLIAVADRITLKKREFEIDSLIAKYNNGDIRANELLSELGKLLPNAVMEMLQGPIQEAHQLRRLIQDNLLARADSKPWFHGGILEPDAESVADWLISLRRFAPDRTSTNLLRDARSLAQLIELGKNPPSNTMFVFVTTDSALRAAYHQYCDEERRKGRVPVPINFRRPREFAPLLNLQSMSGNEEWYGLFSRIQKALDQLLIGARQRERMRNFTEQDKKELQTLPAYIGALATGHQNIGFDSERQIKTIRCLWSQAASLALTVNSDYITKREREHFVSIQQILRNPDVFEAALQQFRSTIDQLSKVHIRFSFTGIVKVFLARARRRAETDAEFRARRAPLHFDNGSFRDIIGETPINKFLDLLYRQHREPPSVETLIALPSVGTSFLFAACVAIVAEDWRSAHSFAQQAYNILREETRVAPKLLDDARYCLAVAARFVMETKNELDVAKKLLELSIKEAQKRRDLFARLRATAEAASLLCVFFYRAALPELANKTNLEPFHFDHLWIECREYLDAGETMLDSEPLSPLRDRSMYLRVQLQLYAVKAALAIYVHWLGSRTERSLESDREKQQSVVKQLSDAIDEWTETAKDTDIGPPYTALLFRHVLDYLITIDPARKEASRSSAVKLLRRLLKFSDELFVVDRAQFNFFLKKLV